MTMDVQGIYLCNRNCLSSGEYMDGISDSGNLFNFVLKWKQGMKRKKEKKEKKKKKKKQRS